MPEYFTDPRDPKRNARTYEEGQKNFEWYELCFCVSGENHNPNEDEEEGGSTLVHGNEKGIVYMLVKEMHRTPTVARLLEASVKVYQDMRNANVPNPFQDE